jgi:hypothetical protein
MTQFFCILELKVYYILKLSLFITRAVADSTDLANIYLDHIQLFNSTGKFQRTFKKTFFQRITIIL